MIFLKKIEGITRVTRCGQAGARVSLSGCKVLVGAIVGINGAS
jgi:hypothetical protein